MKLFSLVLLFIPHLAFAEPKFTTWIYSSSQGEAIRSFEDVERGVIRFQLCKYRSEDPLKTQITTECLNLAGGRTITNDQLKAFHNYFIEYMEGGEKDARFNSSLAEWGAEAAGALWLGGLFAMAPMAIENWKIALTQEKRMRNRRFIYASAAVMVAAGFGILISIAKAEKFDKAGRQIEKIREIYAQLSLPHGYSKERFDAELWEFFKTKFDESLTALIIAQGA